MKKIYMRSLITIIILLGMSSMAEAAHFLSGADGYKAPILPTDGTYYKIYNIYYTANTLKDNSGHNVRGRSFDVDVLAQTHRVGHVTGLKILGWDHLIDVCVPIQYSKMSGAMTGTRNGKGGGGVGDVLLSPLLFGYHTENADFLFSAGGIYIPSGDYDEDDPTSPSLNYWGLLPTFGLTYYLNDTKTASLTGIIRYEHNFSNSDTATKYGNLMHFEGAVGTGFESGIDIALCFAGSWQVSDHKGMGESNDKRMRKQAVGPEVCYTFVDWGAQVSVRWMREFENRNTTQGNLLTLSFIKLF